MRRETLYDSTYYHTSCGEVPYEDAGVWGAFFAGVADKIVSTIAPKTVLDVGCAMGYLVAALRDRGVEAYGIDVSAYAISCVREDIKPFCFVSSALDVLPQDMPCRYDLVTAIEVIEHLYERDCVLFLSNICSYSDDIIFSSSPDDVTEKTHFNVQQAEYWAKKLAQLGYYTDLDYSAAYIAPQSVRFIKRAMERADLVEYYVQHMRIEKTQLLNESQEMRLRLQSEIEVLSHIRDENAAVIKKVQGENAVLETHIARLYRKNADLNDCLEQTQCDNERVQGELSFKTLQFDVMSNSACWKMTKPIRFILDRFRKTIFLKGLIFLKKNGITKTFRKIAQKLRIKSASRKVGIDSVLLNDELQKQRDTQFERKVKFSIIVPLYNTPTEFLEEMISSVQGQTYDNWELCLADGSSEGFEGVQAVCLTYAEVDNRIKYKKLERNLGIAGNTNACIEMAAGDYIAMLDHDDLLHPAALYESMVAICERNADFIYTDELTFVKDIAHPVTVHFKPDFAPDNLRANNYICHFAAFKRRLLNRVGGFSAIYDGSQDHDMYLRLTACAMQIVHIPKVLYYWRSHAGSVASGIGAKNYCIEAGIKAVSDHLSRRSLSGSVEAVPNAGPIYRIKYKINERPLISIIIHGDSTYADGCLNSLHDHSGFDNYEVIIEKTIENEHCNMGNVLCVSTNGMKPPEMINYMSTFAGGKYLVFLDSKMRVENSDWIEELLMYAGRADVGAVGAKAYFANNTIYHAGILVNHGHIGRIYEGLHSDNMGYMGRLMYAQNLSAVSACCMMISKENFVLMGAFDDKFLTLYDVDLCLKLREQGKLIVFNPYAVVRYNGGRRAVTPQQEERRFMKIHEHALGTYDPYYNPNFVESSNDFSL